MSKAIFQSRGTAIFLGVIHRFHEKPTEFFLVVNTEKILIYYGENGLLKPITYIVQKIGQLNRFQT